MSDYRRVTAHERRGSAGREGKADKEKVRRRQAGYASPPMVPAPAAVTESSR